MILSDCRRVTLCYHSYSSDRELQSNDAQGHPQTCPARARFTNGHPALYRSPHYISRLSAAACGAPDLSQAKVGRAIRFHSREGAISRPMAPCNLQGFGTARGCPKGQAPTSLPPGSSPASLRALTGALRTCCMRQCPRITTAASDLLCVAGQRQLTPARPSLTARCEDAASCSCLTT